MRAVYIDIRGEKAIARKLRRLGATGVKRVVQRSLSKGATVRLRAIRAEVPVKTGALKRSFGRKAGFDTRRGEAMVTVGVRARWRDKKSKKIPNFYAGKVHKKNRFMERAAMKSTGEVMRVMLTEAKRAVESLANTG
jgi:hypothetical protein